MSTVTQSWEQATRNQWAAHDIDIRAAIIANDQAFDAATRGMENHLQYYYAEYGVDNEDGRELDVHAMEQPAQSHEIDQIVDVWEQYQGVIKGVTLATIYHMTTRDTLEYWTAATFADMGFSEFSIVDSFRMFTAEASHNDMAMLTGGMFGMDGKRMEQLLSKRWNGELFSSRIWKDKEYLTRWLNTEFKTGIRSGARYDDMTKKLAEAMNVSKASAHRLIVTEGNYCFNQGGLEAMIDAGVTEYIITAIMDGKTSIICSEADGKRYHVVEAAVWVNLPPLHWNCRSSIIPAGVPAPSKKLLDTVEVTRRRNGFGIILLGAFIGYLSDRRKRSQQAA